MLDKNTEKSIDNISLQASSLQSCKKKYILFKYDYRFLNNSYGVNLGDYAQTIAVNSVLHTLYGSVETVFFDRDNLANYDGEEAVCIMQGWFSHSKHFFPNKKLLAVYVGMHMTAATQEFARIFIQKNPNYFKGVTVGCRDRFTRDFFLGMGVDAYLSRCLTLTLPRRTVEASQIKTFIVDIPDEVAAYFPQEILEQATRIEQRMVERNKPTEFYVANYKRFLNGAASLLSRYKKHAKLVITSAIHCVTPCIAMGIPVIFINVIGATNKRTDFLADIIPIYSIEDVKEGRVNFTPESVDIENLKKNMLKNVELSTRLRLNTLDDTQELQKVRAFINDFRYLPLGSSLKK